MKQKVFHLIMVLALTMLSLPANAQVKEFEKYADTKNVTYVFISKYMLRMVGKAAAPSVPGVDVKSLMNKLSGIQIISAEDKTAAARLKAETQAIIKQGKYELLMQVDEDDEKVRIYHHEGNRRQTESHQAGLNGRGAKEKGEANQQSAVVMLTDEDGEVSVIVFSGTFTLDDVMKMTQ